MRLAIIGVWALALAAAGCAPVEASDPDEPEAKLRNAMVNVAGRCAGVVVEGARHVVTAAHCLQRGEAELLIDLADGSSIPAHLLAIDRGRDVAILGLESPAQVRGLTFADTLPAPGTPLLFAGRMDGDGPMQRVTVVRLGRCPSLPDVPSALFTSIRGQRGDSGAPIVDEDLRVVGLVHGGASCSIAAPTHQVPQMIDALTPSS